MTSADNPLGRILLVDDDESMRTVLARALEGRGYGVEAVSSGPAALARLRRVNLLGDARPIDLVITDLKMEPMDGISLLREILEGDYRVTTLMMTAHGTIQSAVEAMRLGAFDYLLKPFAFEDIHRVVSTALETHRRRMREVHVPPALSASQRFDALIGGSERMQEVYHAIERVAPTSATVLVTGETGTGKELVARAIHNLSSRAEGPFVAVNCAALAPSLLESELFGHEKGAFTGATQMHIGRFELAKGGTLFLDEIGEIDLKLQAKLLRVLQNQTFERVGGIRTLQADVRVVSASNVDLREACATGRFREDLYYRLNVFPIPLPPLRARTEDIEPLACHFIERQRESLGASVRGISEEALTLLRTLPWDGNVRELENVIQRAMILAVGEWIEPKDILGESAARMPRSDSDEEGVQAGNAGETAPRKTLHRVATQAAEEAERRVLEQALEAEGGNVTRTARRLGISRTTLQQRMKRYGLRKPD
jgi:DNA-binding NtrC family response regulator